MFLMLPNLKIDLKTTWKWWKIQEVAFQTNEREKWNRESGDDGRLLTFWDILEMAYLTITKRLYHSNVQQIWRFEGHQVHPHFCPYWWYFSFIFQVLICKCVSRRSHSSTRVFKNYQSYYHLCIDLFHLPTWSQQYWPFLFINFAVITTLLQKAGLWL